MTFFKPIFDAHNFLHRLRTRATVSKPIRGVCILITGPGHRANYGKEKSAILNTMHIVATFGTAIAETAHRTSHGVSP